MVLTAVIALIALGMLLLLLEFLVIPGTTYAGIGGLLMISGGVFISYYHYGTTIGHYTLGATALFIFVTIFYSLRSGTWKKLMLKTEIDSKVESFDEEKIRIGDKGTTVSRLAPMGKVLINDLYIEAQAYNQLIDEGTEIEVTRVLSNKIIVKPSASEQI